MIFAYARVSTDRQEAANQKFAMAEIARSAGYEIDEFVEEVVSGTAHWDVRKLGGVLARMQDGDTLLVSEVSRLGRDYADLFEIQLFCWRRRIRLIALKENYSGGRDVNDLLLFFAGALTAYLEREMLSRRTKEALAARKAAGVRLGRPKGTANKHHKLDGMERTIEQMLASGSSKSAVARKCKCHRNTIGRYLKKKEAVA